MEFETEDDLREIIFKLKCEVTSLKRDFKIVLGDNNELIAMLEAYEFKVEIIQQQKAKAELAQQRIGDEK